MAIPLNIEPIKQFFATQPIIRAWLFGSYAKGMANENSDVDILVELDYTQHIGLNFVTMWLKLKELTQKEVDLVPADSIYPIIKPFIDQTKVLIYERQDE